MLEIVTPKSDLTLTNKIANDFYKLEELLFHGNINENRGKISELIASIILYGDEIQDNGVRHDYNNAITFLGQMQMSMDEIIEPINECSKYFTYTKNLVADILDIKTSYNINDIKDILIELSFLNDMKINLIILDGFFNQTNALNIYKGEEINRANHLFIGNGLKNIFPDIELDIRRIFQNLVKNSKEAGADKLTVTFGYLLGSGRLLIKYIDNGSGMSFDIMKDLLFIQGKSTKLNYGINIGEGMHGLTRLFSEKK